MDPLPSFNFRRLWVLLFLMSFIGSVSTASAAQNGFCWNEKIGWVDLAGLTLNTTTRQFTGSMVWNKGTYGGLQNGILSAVPQSGQQVGLTLGSTASSGFYPISGTVFSPQIGWAFANVGGQSPLKVSSTTGDFAGNFWSPTVGWINCDSANVQAANVHSITLPVDSDGDGCSDAQEAIDGTNASSSTSYLDSDNDGVPNCVETAQGTNPSSTTGSFLDTDVDGVSDYQESRCFNSGDGNGDGIVDTLQSSAACVRNTVTNSTTAIAAAGGCNIVKAMSVNSEASLAAQDSTADFPVGLTDFTLQCASPGQSGTVTIYYSQVYTTTGWTFKKFNPLTNTYTDITGSVSVTIGSNPVSGSPVTTVTYTATDNDSITDFDSASAVIRDPAGPAVAVSSSTSTSSGGGGGGGGGLQPGNRRQVTAPGSIFSWFVVPPADSTFHSAASVTTTVDGVTGLISGFIDAEGNPVTITAPDGKLNVQAIPSITTCDELVPTAVAVEQANGNLLTRFGGNSLVFQDVPSSSWYSSTLTTLGNLGIVSGYKNAKGNPTGKYGPADTLTIAQFVKMVTLAAGLKPPATIANVPDANDWSAPYFAALNTRGKNIFSDSKAVDISKPITRAQVAKLMTFVFGVNTAQSTGLVFSDVKTTTLFGSDIEALRFYCVAWGDDKTENKAGQRTFRPIAPLNRGEVTAILVRAMKRFHPDLLLLK